MNDLNECWSFAIEHSLRDSTLTYFIEIVFNYFGFKMAEGEGFEPSLGNIP